jgi:hypothetical protein
MTGADADANPMGKRLLNMSSKEMLLCQMLVMTKLIAIC